MAEPDKNTRGGEDALLILATSCAVVSHRLLQIRFFWLVVHRLSAIGSPAKFIIA